MGFLGSTDSARLGLADPARAEALVTGLRSRRWLRPAPPGEPLLGDRLDIHVAVTRSLESLGWRRFEGRPVRGEPGPGVALATEYARLLLAAGVSERVGDDALASAASRLLATAPWPFDVLVP